MQTIHPDEIKLSPTVRKSLGEGETLLISDGSHLIAFLVSAEPSAVPRPFGLCKGEFVVPDDFDDPSPEIEAIFAGE